MPEKTWKKYDNILFVLSDGLKEITVQTDIAVLAGMGFKTVRNIVLDSIDYFRECKKIIVQVNNNVSDLREWLMNNDFRIIDEKIIFEYKYYEILVIENGKMKLNEQQILFGPYLLREKTKTFVDFYNSQKKKIKNIIKNLNDEHPDKKELETKLLRIKKMLED